MKYVAIQGQLKLLWTVYSEEKLQSCLKLRNFHNHSNMNKTQETVPGPMCITELFQNKSVAYLNPK